MAGGIQPLSSVSVCRVKHCCAVPVSPCSINTRSGVLFVVGTAGHVDHGKSTLVKALTGIDPDRLVEEKAREMTIDLGFAWFSLPSGKDVSIVDVPGHERFIKNMLAGVGGIDAALLVIAADEGVMPQTQEHLAILDLLGVSRGVIALTKRDAVDDEWLELMREDTHQRLLGTSLQDASLIPVSARTGDGLPELRNALDVVLSRVEKGSSAGVARLPVDRVFTVQGFGTVVTGTLLDGPLNIGQDVQILPAGIRGRVRGLQTHKQHVEDAEPGRRLAVNLAGLPAHGVRRGDVLVPAATLRSTRRFDAKVRLTSDAPRAMAHGQRLDLFVGAAESVATLSLLDRDEVLPGDTCYAHVRVSDGLVLLRGDRFILRQPSPSITVGGGIVLDAHPKRHRRKTQETLDEMAALERGTPEDLVLAALGRSGPADRATLLRAVDGTASDIMERMVNTGTVVKMLAAAPLEAGSLYCTRAQWESLSGRITQTVSDYHAAYPLRAGMPRQELKSRLRLDSRVFTQVVEGLRERELLVEQGALVRRANFTVQLDGPVKAEAERLISAIEASGYTPPTPVEIGAGPELLAALVEVGRLQKLNDAVYYTPATYSEMVSEILKVIKTDGSITVAQARDRFGMSRRYALAILEHLDAIRVTRREGDTRVLG
jgi:selenocysteine-specific elongation factor